MECPKCLNRITIESENREDIEGQGYEFDYEAGHSLKPLCKYYKCDAEGGREAIDMIEAAPFIPNLGTKEEQEAEMKKVMEDGFDWSKYNWND